MMNLLTLAVGVASLMGAPASVDSLGIENRNGYAFVIHKVDPGQTLYSLSKRYNCAISDVISKNPELDGGFAIKVGQQIVFPVMQNGTHVKSVKEKSIAKEIVTEKNTEDAEATSGNTPEPSAPRTSAVAFHVVKDGETVYSISRQYGIAQEDLIRINEIQELKINPGQKLIVDKSYFAIKKTPQIKEVKTDDFKEKMAKSGFPAVKMKKVKEVGLAEVINTGNKSQKYLALHRTAPVGSYLTVTNEATGDSVQVKVVGNMAESAIDPAIVVRISPMAFSKLRPRDSKIRAAVSYITPE